MEILNAVSEPCKPWLSVALLGSSQRPLLLQPLTGAVPGAICPALFFAHLILHLFSDLFPEPSSLSVHTVVCDSFHVRPPYFKSQVCMSYICVCRDGGCGMHAWEIIC